MHPFLFQILACSSDPVNALLSYLKLVIEAPWMCLFPSQAVGGESPRNLTEHFSEVLLSLNRHCPALLSQWMKETLQTPGFPSTQVSTEQKHTFIQQLLR